MQTRIMCGNVFEWRIILPAGSRSGGPILFLKISRKRRAFQGGAAPALNHFARRSHQRMTSGHRCWPLMLARQWVSVSGSSHQPRRNQPHAVISDDRELGLLQTCYATSLINSFSVGNLFVDTVSFSFGSSLLVFFSFALFTVISITLFIGFYVILPSYQQWRSNW